MENSTAAAYGHTLHRRREGIPSTSVLVVLIPIAVLVLLIAVILLVVLLRRKAAAAAADSATGNCMFVAQSAINIKACSPEVSGGCLYGSSIGSTGRPKNPAQAQVQVFTLKEVEIATNHFSRGNLIGERVYRGELRDGTVAAIKVLHRQGRQGERAFRSEVDLLSRLRSPYIAELLGYCADQHHRLLVYEYMPNGCLHRHLHLHQNRRRSRALSWGTRLCVALDCARALEYLHEHSAPSVIHRNLKCTNILLAQNFRAKVSGFGLARVGSEKPNGQVSTRVLGAIGYIAPEYASTGKLTTKSDVYSYGVILLELLTGRLPVDTNQPVGEQVLVSWALPQLTTRDKVMEMVDPSLQGQYSQKDLIQVAAIAAMCVQTEADYRPLMTDVVQSLIPLVKNLSAVCPSNSLRFNQSPSPMTASS